MSSYQVQLTVNEPFSTSQCTATSKGILMERRAPAWFLPVATVQETEEHRGKDQF